MPDYVTYTVAETGASSDVRLATGVTLAQAPAKLVRSGRDLNFIAGNVEVPWATLRDAGQLVSLPDDWSAGTGTGGGLMECAIVRDGEVLTSALLSIYISRSPDTSIGAYFNQPIFEPDGSPVTLADDDVIRAYLNTGNGLQTDVG